MALSFTETLTIEVPDVEEQVAAFAEKEYKRDHGLIIEVAAIHEGMTANYNFYPAAALEKAVSSWVLPYPKPIIMNHDPYSEPVGRVMAAKMEKEADGTPYTMLQVAITDPEAVAKVLDQRYLTGSVGGSATEANCSICGVDWAEASAFNIPCKHSRGKTYKGKLCYMEMNGISFKEYSFVNMPADQRSNVRKLSTGVGEDVADDEGWVRAARVFSLDMGKEEILEFSEAEDRNVLTGMRKKDATPVYMQLKGAFLSAMAVAESEGDFNSKDEESELKNNKITEEEDILAVAEGLSSDLSSSDEETLEEEEVTAEPGDEETLEEEPAEEEAAEEEEEVAEPEEEASAEEEEETSEGDKPEGQESPSGDVDPDNSDGAPVSREEEEVAEEETVEEEEEATEEPVSETDLSEATSALESRVEELEAREQTLLEENAKLRDLLKRNLAERVVDMKVALGMEESDDRETLLADHVERSASSLADSLRDLAKMTPIAKEYGRLPEVSEQSGAIEEDGAPIEEAEIEEEEDPQASAEDLFVEALMGRRSL